jgi:hypothetical protein
LKSGWADSQEEAQNNCQEIVKQAQKEKYADYFGYSDY